MSIRILLNGRIVVSLIMLSIFTVMTVLAFGFPTKAGLMPKLIGVPAVLFALFQLVIDIRAVASGTTSDKKDAVNARELKMFLWTFLFFIGLLCFGFIYASPVLIFAYLYIGSNESLRISLISAVSTWAILYLTFVKWFQIPLFNGLILNWLLG